MSEEERWPRARSAFGLTSNQRDFGRHVARLAGIYSAPVIIWSPTDDSIFNSATAFLLKLGSRTFLITNAHVSRFYRQLKQHHPDAHFVFADLSFEPNIISEDNDPNIDLAVIDATGLTFPEYEPGYWDSDDGLLPSGLIKPYEPDIWPLKPPTKGESAITVGWPAKFRNRLNSRSTEFAAFPMLGQAVDEVKPGWFTLLIDRNELVASDFDPNNPAVQETQFEGISGSPVFALHRGIRQIEIIGVVHTYGTGLDILYCARADSITPAGEIRPQNGID
jgi:hypothetical protein